MIRIYYDSLTGNVKRFVEKLEKIDNYVIEKILQDTVVKEDSHLITYTTGIGNVSTLTKKFLAKNENYKKIKTIAVSGNKNWGLNFALAGDKISKKYGIKLILKFELSGTSLDVLKYIQKVKEDENEVDIFE